MTINQGVPAREGVTLALEHDAGRLKATIILSRRNNLSSLFSGPLNLADALRRATQFSVEQGFKGYYDIMEPYELAPIGKAEFQGGLDETKRQIDATMPKTGVRWGLSSPPFSASELADISPAQAHVARLDRLQRTLVEHFTRAGS